MFGTKIISLLVIILLLSIGCKDVPTTVEDAYSAANKNTLNESYLGYEESLLSNYRYDLDDRIEAKFLFYNDKITWGLNSVSPDNKHYLNPFRDTLYFGLEFVGFPLYSTAYRIKSNYVRSQINSIRCVVKANAEINSLAF